jgi:hypothetical protein
MRCYYLYVAALLVVGGVTAERSVAQTPSLDHYRLLQRLSILHQEGGIAGIDQFYRLGGEYDFRHGAGPSAAAAFENADIWGNLISDGPTPPIVLDVDLNLNLEGLEGKRLPFGTHLDIYRFRGLTLNGSSIELYAATLGPWMYLHGDTVPPPESSDYFTNHLRALARSEPFADFNDDGVVDAADYVTLRKTGGSGAGLSAGAGFDEWRRQIGESVPDMSSLSAIVSAAAAGSGASSSVPEPASLSLLVCVGVLVASLPRRSRRRNRVGRDC